MTGQCMCACLIPIPNLRQIRSLDSDPFRLSVCEFDEHRAAYKEHKPNDKAENAGGPKYPQSSVQALKMNAL